MPFGRSFEIARGSSIPWIICGDFNATFDVGIKSLVLPIWRTLERLTLSCKTWSCRSLLLSADDFLGPMEKPSRCGLSWIVFLSIVCVNTFHKMIQNSLPILWSDHVPIRFKVAIHTFNLHPFRYELVICGWLP